MKIYKFFLKKDKNGKIKDMQVVKEGFNFYVIIFQFFYLIYLRLWKHAIILFVIMMFSNIIVKYNLNFIAIPLQISVLLYYAFELDDLVAINLVKNKYEYLGKSFGNDPDEAKLNFLKELDKNYSGDDKLEKIIY